MKDLYVVVEAASGKRLRQADTRKDVGAIAKGESLIVLSGKAPPDERVEQWNPTLAAFEPVPVDVAPVAAPLTVDDVLQLRATLQTWLDQVDAQLNRG